MTEIITNLHPDGDKSTNLYPNIKKENIPSKSISTDKLDDNVLSLIGSLKPSGTDTSTNILAFTSNKGIYVATDNGHWYYWNGSAYADGGAYQAIEIDDGSVTKNKLSANLISEQINLEKASYEVVQKMPIDVWEEETNYTDQEGYYWLENGTLQPNSQSIACKCPVEFGKKYKISTWTNYGGIWVIRLLKYDGTTEQITDYQSNQPLVDYEVIPTYDTQALLISHHTTSPSITIKKNKLANAYGENDVKKYIDENVLYGISETKSGSYFQKWIYNFSKVKQYRVTLLSSVNAYAMFYGLVDKTDTTNTNFQFQLNVGKSILWTPTKDFEALYYSANGSISVKIDFPDYALEGISNVFYCGVNREIKTLKEGIEKATAYMNSILYVDDGVYDLIQEFGSDYFANLTSKDTMSGLQLSNRIHIIFSSNSKVVCNYTGDNQYVKKLFSPFNVGVFGFTLENLNLECSNVRYAIHDERNGSTEQCQSIYKNCNISLDNSNNQEWKGATCIGGGLGSNHCVDIQNCVFTANRVEGFGEFNVGVYYHQSNDLQNPSHRGTINISNCYFTNCIVTFQFSRADADEDTIVQVNGNSMYPFSGSDEQGVYVSEMIGTKIKLYEWNNVVRS